MKQIISVSRRTDIPASYGNEFMNDVDIGFINIVNPYNKKEKNISLKLDDVSDASTYNDNNIDI